MRRIAAIAEVAAVLHNAPFPFRKGSPMDQPTATPSTPKGAAAAAAAGVFASPPPDDAGWSPALRTLTSPKDANHQGSVFGGVILSLIDQAGYVEARRHGVHRWVTVAIQAVEFHQPVWMGDVVTLFTRTTRTGTTSVTVQVRVEAERYTTGERVRVTEAMITLVATDAVGTPIPFKTTGSQPFAPQPVALQPVAPQPVAPHPLDPAAASSHESRR